jgi:hypothetical protein
MFNVIVGGSDAFDAVLYPQQNPNVQAYLYQQVSNISQTLTDVGRQFMASAQTVYDQINSSQAMALAQAAIRAAKGLFHPNQIIDIDTLMGLQSAQPVMQRWIMSCPDVRERYNRKQCAGYGDTYVDVSPGGIRETDYNYRRVMNGVVQEEGDEVFVRHYQENLLEGDAELTPWQQHAVLRSWDIAALFMAQGHDVTDIYQGKL